MEVLISTLKKYENGLFYYKKVRFFYLKKSSIFGKRKRTEKI